MALESLGSPAEPTVEVDAEGLYVLRWPRGRPATVALTADLLESMVEDINAGRKAIAALQGVAAALSGLVPSASSEAPTS